MARFYKHGDFNAVCDLCGFTYHASQLRKQWDGLMVCRKDFSKRHPQEFVRGVPDPASPLPWTRPEQPDVFITTPVKASDL